MRPPRREKANGFTLIEVVVVIVILGVLAAIALPRFLNLKTDATKAVTSSVMGSFNSAASLVHAKWMAQGKPSTLLVDGNTVQIGATGFPDIPTPNSAGCISLWDDIMDASMNMIVYPGAVPVTDWSALRFGVACVYINHSGDTFSAATTPFFAYFTTTGQVLGFNLN